MEKKMNMKETLLNTVRRLREDERIDFTETPPLFTWTYPEEPTIKFEMLITEGNELEIPFDTPLQ